MTTSYLVTHTDLAQLRDKDLNLHQYTRLKFMAILAAKHLDANNFTTTSIVHALAGVAHILGLFTKDCTQQTLLTAELLLALWCNLADQDITRLNLRANLHNTALIQVAKAVLTHIGNIACHDFWTKLCLAHLDGVVLDIDTGKGVIFYQATAQNHRVVHVVAAPRHKGYQQVLTEGELTIGNGRALDERVALRNGLATANPDFLVDTTIVIALGKVNQVVALDAISIAHLDCFAISPNHFSISLGRHKLARVARHLVLNASANRWRLRLQKRHCLALHVRASQAAVDTVLLDEWHEARGRPKDLLVCSVHVGNFARIYLPWLEELARTNAIAHKGTILIETSTGVGNHLCYFLRSIEVDDFISHAAINHFEVWCLNKAVFVDTCIGGEVQHQANVGSLWCLHRANPAIVGGVSIAHLKAGSLAAQTTRPHRAQATLVAQLGQWVHLIK